MDNSQIPMALKRATLLGVLLVVPLLMQAQNSDSKAITDLLKEAKQHAVLAADDAATLENYAFSRVSWQSHAYRLNEMKEHATDLISEFDRLNSLRNEGSPWQQEAIDRINPLLREMADNLNATIKHFNENQKRLNMPPFRDYAKANHELMNRTATLISDLVEYGEAKAKSDALVKTLDLPLTARENE